MKGKFHPIRLSLLSSLLLSLSWYFNLSICVFFAFVPLLFLERSFAQSASQGRSKLKLFAYVYVCFLIWNIGVTWWVVYASIGGALMAFILNALLMSIVFLTYSFLKARTSSKRSAWILLPLWIAWEHGHTLWDLTWTWLTLGNVFAFHPQWIQWYEFTGTSGGSIWALAVNILIFETIQHHQTLRFFSKPILKIASLIILPILCSYLILAFQTTENYTASKIKTVVVQPNSDPYNAKFSVDFQSQFNAMLKQINGVVSSETDYLVLPETFITEDLNEATIQHDYYIHLFRDSILRHFPNLKIITGANTYVFYEDAQLITATSREDKRSGKHYDVFNTALYISATDVQVYHKSKLVPGVERMPFPALLKPLEKLAINMGGTMGSLGTQSERAVFAEAGDKTAIAPVICYESVYADFVSEYIRKGAGLIFIITNDGWWDDTPGYKQHLNYARMRAIENRRQIARCANTGVSCFIDQYGNVFQSTEWWKEALIQRDLTANTTLSFFSRYGDLLSYMSVMVSILLLLKHLILRLKN